MKEDLRPGPGPVCSSVQQETPESIKCKMSPGLSKTIRSISRPPQMREFDDQSDLKIIVHHWPIILNYYISRNFQVLQSKGDLDRGMLNAFTPNDIGIALFNTIICRLSSS